LIFENYLNILFGVSLNDGIVFAASNELDSIPEVPKPVTISDGGHRRRAVLLLFVSIDERIIFRELEFFGFGC
jgi:hypothetical protein